MDKTFETIISIRETTSLLMEDLSLEEINRIPKGFSNNILWNMGHMLVILQKLTYGLSGQTLLLSDELMNTFAKGTQPVGNYSKDTYEKVKKLLVCTAKDLKQDYESGIFKEFNQLTTGLGVTLTSINEAIHFVAVHEGIHYGYILALRKAVKAKKKGLFS